MILISLDDVALSLPGYLSLVFSFRGSLSFPFTALAELKSAEGSVAEGSECTDIFEDWRFCTFVPAEILLFGVRSVDLSLVRLLVLPWVLAGNEFGLVLFVPVIDVAKVVEGIEASVVEVEEESEMREFVEVVLEEDM
jgi:hypothetical protein